MINSKRGEIEANLGNRPVKLCLTFGALVSLERSLGFQNISELATRLSSGHLSASDLLAILIAGLEGAGDPMSAEDLKSLDIKTHWSVLVDTVARLLIASFGEREAEAVSPL